MLTSSKQLGLKRYQSKPKFTTKQLHSRRIAKNRRFLEKSKYTKRRGSKISKAPKAES